jgi:hypothetical protein
MKVINIDKLFDIALVCGIVFLAYHNMDGWGWLVFILIIKQ